MLAAWPPACLLRPAHFVCHCIGWGAKSERIRAAAAAMGVAHGAVLFIDDMPGERAEVKTCSASPCSRGAPGLQCS